MSDWGAVYHRVPALRRGARPGDAAEPAAQPGPDRRGGAVRGAVRARSSTTACARVLELVDKGMGVLELDEDFDADAHHRLARAAAARVGGAAEERGRRSCRCAPPARIAVIGEFARTPRFQGAGSSQVTPTRVDTALDELPATFAEVTFARRLRHRRHRRRRGAARRGRGGRGGGRDRGHADRPARRGRVGGLRPHAHEPAGQPDRRPARGRGGQPATWWWCWSTAPRSCSATSSRTRGRWSRRGWAARPPAARSPTCCPAW